MCDSEECMEQMMTVLNVCVPQVLARSEHYVVKGGRAIDYHIMKKNGIRLLRLTDWDIAVDSIESEQTLADAIKEELKTYNIGTIQTKLNFKGIKGLQISIQCGEGCAFIDIIQYEPTDEIFQNTEIDKNIRYIPYEYTIRDLEETYLDRERDLDEYFHHIGIDIHASQITSDNADQMTDVLRNFITMRYMKKYEEDKVKIDEMLTDEDYKITPAEHTEEMNELAKRHQDANLHTEKIVGRMKERFQKLARTKYRKNVLIGERHGGKTRKKRRTRRR